MYFESVVNYQCQLNPIKSCNIWFNETTQSTPFKDIVELLLGSLRLGSVSRTIRRLRALSWSFTTDLYRLVFVNLETDELRFLAFRAVKYVVLGKFTNCEELDIAFKCASWSENLDVVYFSTTIQLMCRNRPYCNHTEAFREYPAPEDLFPDQTENFCQSAVIGAAMLDTELKRKVNGTLIGPDVNWISEIAKRINATTKFVAVYCDEAYWHPRCIAKMVHRGKQADVILDQILNQLPGCLESVEPYSFSVYVPRGRPLTSLELFIAPFHLHLWITLALLVIILKLLEIVCPRQLRAGFTFSTICGFKERSDVLPAEVICSSILNLMMFFIF